MKKVGTMKGSDPIDSDIKLLNRSLQRKMLEMNVRSQYIVDTFEQVQSFSEYNPKILKWLFDEQ